MTYKEAKPYLKVGMTVIPRKMHVFRQLENTECRIYEIHGPFIHIKNKENKTGCFADYNQNDELEILTNPDGTTWTDPRKVVRVSCSTCRGAISENSKGDCICPQRRQDGSWDNQYTVPASTVSECSGSSAPKFKVGDRVKVSVQLLQDIPMDSIGIIKELNYPKRWYVHFPSLHKIHSWHEDYLEKIEDEPMFEDIWIRRYMAYDYAINEPKAQKKGIIMSVVDKLKNLALSKEDRILREEGLEDENGNMTSEAMDLMDDELQKERWVTRRMEIAKDLLTIKEEAKK